MQLQITDLDKFRGKQIDAFQKKLLRKMMHLRWPNIVSNDEHWRRTNFTSWSYNIAEHRLCWFGHTLRLPAQSAVRTVVDKIERPAQKTLRSADRDVADLFKGAAEKAQRNVRRSENAGTGQNSLEQFST